MAKSLSRSVFKVGIFLAFCVIVKLRGGKILYSVHNLSSHDQFHPVLERMFWPIFIRLVDAFHHLNNESSRLFGSRLRANDNSFHFVLGHPRYENNSIRIDQSEVRDGLSISRTSFVVGIFGLIRPYKGIDEAIRVFRTYDDHNAVLIVAGRPVSEEELKRIELLASGDARIRIIPKFVDRTELAELIASTDVVLLAHKKLNNSGIAMEALSHDRPILAPDSGAILDLESDLGAEWVMKYRHPLRIEDFRQARRAFFGRGSRSSPNLAAYERDHVGDKLAEYYSIIISTRPKGRSHAPS